MKSSLHFAPASFLEVVGHDSEYADLDNPRGEIVHPVWYVVASDNSGRRFISDAQAGRAGAEALAARLNGLAVELDGWVEIDAVYGSEAYEAQAAFAPYDDN